MARRRRKGRPINGWLVIDKPTGMTSTHVVNVVKAMTRAQKVGHGGTLDPLATGILPMALGDATKTVAYVMESAKSYRFTMRFGIRTDTDDSEGEVVETSERRPSDEEIRAGLDDFVGEIMQRPPSYAAVKIQGERAYDIARRGETVELEARPIRIDDYTMTGRPSPDEAVFEVTCGKGAYVRALARDLGEALGCKAHVSALRRLAVGGFDEDNAISLDNLRQIVDDDSLPQVLVPLRTALAGIPAFALTEPQAVRLCSGQSIVISPKLVTGLPVDHEPEDDGDGLTVQALKGGEVVALARLHGSELSPLRVFNPQERAN